MKHLNQWLYQMAVSLGLVAPPLQPLPLKRDEPHRLQSRRRGS
ncbi:MAG: PA1414 family protein [Pseudomonadota bacterium]